ncbi:tubulin-specific chaperone D-like protein [Leptotrombidium deliense]|uniref:Tubulin-specific chaperone D n=1 Tax=Leptotrombidium deliense TaxID=299467 RepID=A0A443SPK2_9ACAR|nr:tubulin-specific chaperone D-like protein [Leptotrombidium deliense]
MEDTNASTVFYDTFCEKEDVLQIIDEMKMLTEDYDSIIKAECLYDKLRFVLDKYQQQPHLLDPHIAIFVQKLLSNFYVKDKEQNESMTIFRLSMKCLYHLCKVRGFKTFIRYFPHEVTDIEPVLSLLAKQSTEDTENWESSYMLLLWLSILVKLPFHLKRFDTCDGDNVPIMQRILQLIKQYLVVYGKSSEAAAFLCARFLTRPEITKECLQPFIDWCLPILESVVSGKSKFTSTVTGILLALAYIFKVGRRDDIIKFGPTILEKISTLNLEKQKHECFVKLVVKLSQRIGLSFLKLKIAPWRYSRGKRCLIDNLSLTSQDCNSTKENGVKYNEEDEDDDEGFDDSHLSEVETVIEMLLLSLKDKSTLVRWSAAKGIGRVCERLSREMGRQVVHSVFELCTPRESDCTMHGVCLTLAELSRRGLILPEDLGEAVNIVKKALIYDELKGSFSVGANVRDAACYVCWAFARAYDKDVMKPYVNDIATSLLVVAVFDREVNCRRAASAAFQENVGRQGNFPNGIEILTTVDHFAVGCRKQAFLELSVFVGSFSTYTKPLIIHLVDHKVHHWDWDIRDLTSKALHKLSMIASPDIVRNEVLSKLVENSCCSAVFSKLKHGSILGAANVIHALYLRKEAIPENVLEEIKSISLNFKEKNLLRSPESGELMKHAMSVLIEKVSLSKLNFANDNELIELWIDFLKEIIDYVDPSIREYALCALTPFCDHYLRDDQMLKDRFIAHLLSRVTSADEQAKCGALDALCRIPDSMLTADSPPVILEAVLHFLRSLNFSQQKQTNAKATAINCLSHTIIRLNPIVIFGLGDVINDVLSFFLLTAMEDYTRGSRGDIGLMVRIAAIEAVKNLSLHFAKHEIKRFFTGAFVTNVFTRLLPHCVSPQDKMRAVACGAFFELLHSSLPHIPHQKEIQEAFTFCSVGDTDWRKESLSYSLFCKLLPLRMLTNCLWTGIVMSVGGMTASIVKHSREALSSTLMNLKSVDNDFDYVCGTFFTVFKENVSSKRMCEPLIITLDYLISTGFLDDFDNSVITNVLQLCWSQYEQQQSIDVKKCNVKKIIAIANLYCNSLRFQGCYKRCLTYLVHMLFKSFPKVRVSVADSLYTALITYGDVVEMEDIEAVTQILVDNDWNKEIEELNPLREKLNTLLSL